MSKQLTHEKLAAIKGGGKEFDQISEQLDFRKNKSLSDRYSRIFRLFDVLKGA